MQKTSERDNSKNSAIQNSAIQTAAIQTAAIQTAAIQTAAIQTALEIADLISSLLRNAHDSSLTKDILKKASSIFVEQPNNRKKIEEAISSLFAKYSNNNEERLNAINDLHIALCEIKDSEKLDILNFKDVKNSSELELLIKSLEHLYIIRASKDIDSVRKAQQNAIEFVRSSTKTECIISRSDIYKFVLEETQSALDYLVETNAEKAVKKIGIISVEKAVEKMKMSIEESAQEIGERSFLYDPVNQMIGELCSSNSKSRADEVVSNLFSKQLKLSQSNSLSFTRIEEYIEERALDYSIDKKAGINSSIIDKSNNTCEEEIIDKLDAIESSLKEKQNDSGEFKYICKYIEGLKSTRTEIAKYLKDSAVKINISEYTVLKTQFIYRYLSEFVKEIAATRAELKSLEALQQKETALLNILAKLNKSKYRPSEALVSSILHPEFKEIIKNEKKRMSNAVEVIQAIELTPSSQNDITEIYQELQYAVERCLFVRKMYESIIANESEGVANEYEELSSESKKMLSLVEEKLAVCWAAKWKATESLEQKENKKNSAILAEIKEKIATLKISYNLNERKPNFDFDKFKFLGANLYNLRSFLSKANIATLLSNAESDSCKQKICEEALIYVQIWEKEQIRIAERIRNIIDVIYQAILLFLERVLEFISAFLNNRLLFLGERFRDESRPIALVTNLVQWLQVTIASVDQKRIYHCTDRVLEEGARARAYVYEIALRNQKALMREGDQYTRDLLARIKNIDQTTIQWYRPSTDDAFIKRWEEIHSKITAACADGRPPVLIPWTLSDYILVVKLVVSPVIRSLKHSILYLLRIVLTLLLTSLFVGVWFFRQIAKPAVVAFIKVLSMPSVQLALAIARVAAFITIASTSSQITGPARTLNQRIVDLVLTLGAFGLAMLEIEKIPSLLPYYIIVTCLAVYMMVVQQQVSIALFLILALGAFIKVAKAAIKALTAVAVALPRVLGAVWNILPSSQKVAAFVCTSLLMISVLAVSGAAAFIIAALSGSISPEFEILGYQPVLALNSLPSLGSQWLEIALTSITSYFEWLLEYLNRKQVVISESQIHCITYERALYNRAEPYIAVLAVSGIALMLIALIMACVILCVDALPVVVGVLSKVLRAAWNILPSRQQVATFARALLLAPLVLVALCATPFFMAIELVSSVLEPVLRVSRQVVGAIIRVLSMPSVQLALASMVAFIAIRFAPNQIADPALMLGALGLLVLRAMEKFPSWLLDIIIKLAIVGVVMEQAGGVSLITAATFFIFLRAAWPILPLHRKIAGLITSRAKLTALYYIAALSLAICISTVQLQVSTALILILALEAFIKIAEVVIKTLTTVAVALLRVLGAAWNSLPYHEQVATFVCSSLLMISTLAVSGMATFVIAALSGSISPEFEILGYQPVLVLNSLLSLGSQWFEIALTSIAPYFEWLLECLNQKQVVMSEHQVQTNNTCIAYETLYLVRGMLKQAELSITGSVLQNGTALVVS